jgi:DNA-directed DNA polymerase III (polc)
MFLIFDTETTGLPLRKDAPLTDFGNWPRIVQLAWQIHDEKGRFIEAQNHLIYPEGFIIPINTTMVHGITTEHAQKVGEPLDQVLNAFLESANKVKYLVGHNVDFDLNVLGCEFLRLKGENPLGQWLKVDTCTEKTAEFCKFSGGRGGRFKLPSLLEIYKLLFGCEFDSAHNASADVEATSRVFLELVRLQVLTSEDIPESSDFFQAFKEANPDVIQSAGISIVSNADAVEEQEKEREDERQIGNYKPKSFTHLHVHSHYSILDGMSKVADLVDKCKKNGMYSIALTDHGNMFGIKELADYSNKINFKLKDKIKEQKVILENEASTDEQKSGANAEIEKLEKQFFKPIFGIEAYCAPVSIDKRDGRGDRGWHLILLAKNKTGYRSLCKLSSIAYTDGFYYNPRIDHSLLEKYHDGLVVMSACLGGEIPQKIMNGDYKGAEQSLLWFKSIFGNDFYLEIQRHKTDKPGGDREIYERQKEVNKVILELAKKTNTKIVATNDVHFVEEEHGEAHDRLICLSTGKELDDPNRMHYTKQEWLKVPEEMGAIFSDIPEALENTKEIVDKVESYSIDSDPIMPMFQIPEEFGTVESYRQKFTEEDLFNEFTRDEYGNVVLSQEAAEKKIKRLGGYDKLYRIKLEADYLAELTWKGARLRYGDVLTDEQHERIVFELHVMKTMGFPGYFLIVQDYIRGAREELGVSVGPGRGSAAGSVVAYCLKITDVDPLKYDLLFERFLNPDRISLPDIDVDFEDNGRGRVLDWITKKYGKEKVAHIITYGTMGSKSAIADVGRVQKVPLSTVAQIKSFIPEKVFPDSIKDEKGKSPKVNLKNCYKYIPELKQMLQSGDANISTMLTYAEELEDTNRQIGIHACGVIIGADDLTKYAPICTIKDKSTGEDVIVTQYDGHAVESVGLIKMDFLGLKNLTLIKDALANIKKSHGIEVDIDHIPIDDKKTYDLFSEGSTVGTFQFESIGMRKYLRELQPSTFEDLIAMIALYRPGPMQYIPQFIDRKLGKEPITYDIPEMEKYLKDTYGITVYQEQVMLLSRMLANFTRGESDTLRKAMGKKQIDKMMELKGKFMKQGQENGHNPKVLEKIWADWEQFASYAFNKSHATCYSLVSYQTAYLKAHYPAEYMAAVLNNSIGDIKVVTSMIEECRRMKLEVLGPDINESQYKFGVNDKGKIRFGLGGIKNVGEAAVENIIEERDSNGYFKDLADFLTRINLRSVNRRAIETMCTAGCFDSFPGFHRAMFSYIAPGETTTFSEKAIRMANVQNERKKSSQIDMFGFGSEKEDSGAMTIPLPECEHWSKMKELKMELESIGLCLSSHPMDMYGITLKYFSNINIENLNLALHNADMVNRSVSFGAQVTSAENLVSTNTNKKYGRYRVEDKTGSYEFRLFGENYLNNKNLLVQEEFVLITGTLMPPYRKKSQDPNQIPSTLDLKITDVKYLDSILEHANKKAVIRLNVAEMEEVDMDNFIRIIKDNPGKQSYVIHLYDAQKKVSCNMSPYSGGIMFKEVLPLLQKTSFASFDLT